MDGVGREGVGEIGEESYGFELIHIISLSSFGTVKCLFYHDDCTIVLTVWLFTSVPDKKNL